MATVAIKHISAEILDFVINRFYFGEGKTKPFSFQLFKPETQDKNQLWIFCLGFFPYYFWKRFQRIFDILVKIY